MEPTAPANASLKVTWARRVDGQGNVADKPQLTGRVPFSAIHEKLSNPESDHNLASIGMQQIKSGSQQGYGRDGNPKGSSNPRMPRRGKDPMAGKPKTMFNNFEGPGANAGKGNTGIDS
jgi:hypothetical protein